MKKNFLFKGVSVLGAMLLLANVVLPGLQVYADEPEYSAGWDFYALHALPANDETITENSKENGGNGTYTSADGTYTVTIDEEEKSITYSNITLKDPGEGIVGTATEGRPGGYVWFGAKFENGGEAEKSVKIGSQTMDDGIVWAAIAPTKVQQLVNAGTFTKEWTVDATYDGVETQYKMIVDLNNIEILDTDENENASLIKVVDGKIVELNVENAYTITFNTDGGNSISPIKAVAGTAITAPSNPTKAGYTFAGWDKTIPETMPENDLTITAKWNKNSSSSSSGGGGGSKKSTTKTDDTKANTGDTAKTDEQKVDENKTEEETVNEENKVEEKAPMTDAQAVAKFGQEQIDAYKWALENGITTMETVEEARLDYPLTRAELAKMMVVYVAKILGKQPVLTGNVGYQDVDANKLGDLAGYIQLAYQYQIMGIDANGNPIEFFNPNGLVTRGEYATVFSRVLFGALFNKEGEDFYTDHIEALNKAGILSDTNPTQREMRGWVMLMMYRSSKNADKIASVIEALGATEEEVADAQAKAEEEGVNEENAENAEATTGDVAEAPEAEASTGAVAE